MRREHFTLRYFLAVKNYENIMRYGAEKTLLYYPHLENIFSTDLSKLEKTIEKGHPKTLIIVAQRSINILSKVHRKHVSYCLQKGFP